MRAGLGWSTLASEEDSLKEALSQAVHGSGSFSFALLFATPQHDPHRLIETFLELAPSAKLLGCSAEGVIAGDRLLHQGIVLVTIGGEIQSQTFSLPQEPGGPYALGIRAGEELRRLCPSPEGGAVFIFPDPSLEVPFLLQGMYNVLGPKFLYLGGGTGPLRWTEKGVNSGPLSLGVLAGIDFSSAVGHGWSPTQGLLVVTRVQGREVLEIDGVTPLEAYRARIGNLSWDVEEVGALYPLGFPNIFGDLLIRDPVYLSPSGHMGFVGASIFRGAVGYVMKGEKEKVLATSREVAQRAREGIEEACFALVFDCISRSFFLGAAFEEELKGIQGIIGTIPLAGFLSVGEIHPYGCAPFFHNKSVVVALGGKGRKVTPLSSFEISQEAELAALHEISAMTFPGSYEEFFQDAVMRAARLFGLQRIAFLGERHGDSVFLASFGFSSPSEVQREMENLKDNQCVFPVGEEGELGILFLESPRPVETKEYRLYNLFARKIGETLYLARHLEEKEKRMEELERLSLTDELTGLYNRRGLLLLAEHSLSLARRENKKAALLFIDLDGLKWINDHFGHEEGDRVIEAFGTLARKAFRQSDILARIGGDEFVALLLGAQESEIEKILARLNSLVDRWNKNFGKPYRLSFSSGWALFDPSRPQKIKELLLHADQDMYGKKWRKRPSSYPYLSTEHPEVQE